MMQAGMRMGLTAREREVLEWLSGGKRDRDIADLLGISHRTVHKHLQRIYEKLGVETRTAAVMRAFGARLLRSPVVGVGALPAGMDAAAPPRLRR